ncbi:MAG: YbbR-like domain-containing protein [Armatimonadota bacterium]
MDLSGVLDAIRDNWPAKLLSLVVAVVLWFYVLGAEDPQKTQALTVPVTTVNVPEDLEVIAVTPESVELRVRGRESALRQLQERRIRVVADLSNGRVGKNEVPLQVSGVPLGINVVPTYQSSATVELDKVVERIRPVQIERQGEPARGFVIDQIVAEPAEVLVIGATSRVREVSRVLAVVDVSGLNRDEQFEVELVARDRRNLAASGVRFEPPRVTVRVKVRQVNVRTVPVRPVLGEPPAGWRVVGVTTNPPVVTVTGEAGLADLTSVATAPVDISGLRGAKTYSVSLNVPTGLAVLGAASVEVTVRTQSTSGAAPGGPPQPPRGGAAPTGPEEGAEEDIGPESGNQQEGPTGGGQPEGGDTDAQEGGGTAPAPAPNPDGAVTTPARPGQ